MSNNILADFEIKSVDEDGTFEGYASVFDQVDQGKDVVEKGAFNQSLKARGIEGVKLLWQHDPTQPIGQIISLYEDQRGLFVKGHLNLDVQRAREALHLMQEGVLDGLSIGFRTVRSRINAQTGFRHLLELDLWEVSLVTFPMQQEARISSFRATNIKTIRDYEAFLREAGGFSRQEAVRLASGGFKGLINRTSTREAADQNAHQGLRQQNWGPVLQAVDALTSQLKNGDIT